MADNVLARSAFRALAASVRAIPETLGQRPTTVTLRLRTYSGPVNAAGTTLVSTVDTVLAPRPRVRQVTDGQRSYFGGGTLAAYSGNALAGVYEIGPITPPYPGGGYAAETVMPAASVSTRLTVVLEGPEFTAGGEEFTVTAADWTRPQGAILQVTRSAQGA